MASIDENTGLRTGGFGEQQRHAPVGDVGVVEGGFERLVFEQQALARLERRVNLAQGFLEKSDARANALRAGVVGAVGKPGRDVARAERAGDGDAIEYVVDSAAANRGVRVSDRAVLVFLVLKNVGVDGSGPDRELLGEGLDARDVRETNWQIPLHMKS